MSSCPLEREREAALARRSFRPQAFSDASVYEVCKIFLCSEIYKNRSQNQKPVVDTAVANLAAAPMYSSIVPYLHCAGNASRLWELTNLLFFLRAVSVGSCPAHSEKGYIFDAAAAPKGRHASCSRSFLLTSKGLRVERPNPELFPVCSDVNGTIHISQSARLRHPLPPAYRLLAWRFN